MCCNHGGLYGTTLLGAANGNYGTVFKITPSGTLTTLHSFAGSPSAGRGMPNGEISLRGSHPKDFPVEWHPPSDCASGARENSGICCIRCGTMTQNRRRNSSAVTVISFISSRPSPASTEAVEAGEGRELIQRPLRQGLTEAAGRDAWKGIQA